MHTHYFITLFRALPVIFQPGTRRVPAAGRITRFWMALILTFISIMSQAQLHSTIRVSGKNLVDIHGERIIARGVENSFGIGLSENGWFIDEIAKTGANAIRILPNLASGQLTLSQVENLLVKAKGHGMVIYISPGGLAVPGGSTMNEECWKWFERNDVYTMLQKYKENIIIDAIQEQSHNDATRWVNDCKTAITRMRNRGYQVPLLMMSNEYGRNHTTVINRAREVFDFDPQRNTFFNVQAYWDQTWGTPKQWSTEIIQQRLGQLSQLEYAVQIGICPWAEGAPCDNGYVDYKTAMAECQKYGMGWLVWEWHNPYEWSKVFQVSTNGNFGSWSNHCTWSAVNECRRGGKYGCDYGYQVTVGHAASIQRTSVKTCYFRNGTNCGGGTTPPPSGVSGDIVREVWTGVSGTAVSQIPLSQAPSATSVLTSLEGPTNWGDNYGARIRGYIVPQQSGSYTFYVAGDDNTELWLSTSDAPANKAKIAEVTGWTNVREWNKYPSQRAAARNLTAGTRYYVEVLHKEATGGDNVAVGWTGPGYSSITVVPGAVLSRYSAGGTADFNGTYKLVARHSNKVLDVQHSSTANGANVWQWHDNGSLAQQWIITPTSGGHYRLVSRVSSKALEVSSNSTADGGNVQQWEYVGANSQQWRIEATSGGFYRLINRHSGKALEVAGGSTADGANVQQWTFGGGNNQQWRLEQLSTATARTASAHVAGGEFTDPESIAGVLGSIRVYPNPTTTGQVYIQSSRGWECRAALYTAQGRRIPVESQITPGGLRFDLSTLANGLYLIEVTYGGQSKTFKVINR